MRDDEAATTRGLDVDVIARERSEALKIDRSFGLEACATLRD